jgi:hypothetical protein
MSITTFGLMDEIDRLQEENAELRRHLEKARADLEDLLNRARVALAKGGGK